MQKINSHNMVCAGREDMNSKFLLYILKRFGMALLTIFLVIAITFFVMHAIPASPFSVAEDSLRLVREENPMSVLMTFSASRRARR